MIRLVLVLVLVLAAWSGFVNFAWCYRRLVDYEAEAGGWNEAEEQSPIVPKNGTIEAGKGRVFEGRSRAGNHELHFLCCGGIMDVQRH